MMSLADGKKDVDVMFSSLDTMYQCDRQTDRQTVHYCDRMTHEQTHRDRQTDSAPVFQTDRQT